VSSSRHSRRDTPLQVSAGVEDLITRLRDQGVAAGKTEADRLVQEAKDKAAALLQDAETQAKAVLQKAHSEADALRQAGQEALELAFRDTVIALRSELSRRFAGEVQRLVREEEQLENGTLTRFVRLMSQKMLRDGVEFGKAGDNATGLRLRLVDRDIVLDLSDKAVADVILAHLQPRFRALLEGVVK
jgi:V/A-type H+-transporting ATPase subunit E